MLNQICSRNQGEHNVGRKAVFELFFDAQGIRRVHYNAGMLGRNDRLYDIGKVVHVWQGLDAEYNIVERGCTTRGSVLRARYD